MSGPDDIVLVAGDWRVSRAEYADRLARAITVLRDLGVEEGGCIGVALRNCPQFFELFAAAGLIGAKSVPIAWRLKREEVAYLIADSGARSVFYDADSAAQMAGLPGAISLEDYEMRLQAASPAPGIDGTRLKFNMELYSSGTTGRPKAIERGQPTPEQMQRLMSGAFNLPKLMGVDGPGEVHMMTGPLYHSQPIGFSTQALAAGQRVVMMSGGFDAETCLATIAREKVTWITCVPTHLIRILALPEEVRGKYDLSSLKAVLHSAAPCPRDVKAAVIKLLPPAVLWEVYGGTEGAMTMISPGEWLEKPGSVGQAFPPGNEIRILDLEGNPVAPGAPGLIYGQPIMSFNYRGARELDGETWRDGLFTLGDIGYLDEDGYLFITDRLKDMIISGGANIYPAEVEATLFNHPAVGDASVIGVPDQHWGEKVKAIVELRAQASEADIIAFCREHLAHYKCPASVDFVDKLPRDPNGKVRKRELREPYWADAGRAV
ncbi:AMP-binding protein [Novosphingobium sp. G106]|uniref:AMP-binding protein n=1 Tax=Novosphingobium sp. G106 TaxID=2849500 RepID=UPI001C2D0557|nr:AMP-binding protein [Novosphingobium sp. G106]MBV1686790.1 AMP-binding protein [Novosphingobium sp. G106]